MFDFIFGGIGGLFNKWDAAIIDNNVFRMHYRNTLLLLLSAIFLVSSRQFIGSPIHCMTDSMSSGVMDSYCWIHSTFSVSDSFRGTIGEDHSYPGVSPLGDSQYHHHKFYQWVIFFLTLQMALFYLPRMIWKSYEGGVMKLLTYGMTDITAFMDGDRKRDGIDVIARFYSMSGAGRGKFFLVFVICEILNFVNVLGQIYFTDKFLGYQFTTYGTNVLSQTEGNITARTDYLNVVFPKVAKCTFNKYGVSGQIQSHDALCVLPLNIINEKIYVALWFWFIFLASLTGAWLIYRLVNSVSLPVRVSVLYARAGGMVRKEKIRAALQNPDHNALQRLGDYLMLYLLAKNLSPLILKDMFDRLAPEKYGAVDEELQSLKKSADM